MIRASLRCALLALGLASGAHGAPITIVAVESVYGDIARTIGGDGVAVVSILAGAEQDPHEFEAAAGAARALASARLVILNGAGYDPWAEQLLATASSSPREVIDVARLVGRTAADNPHLWYDTEAVSALARALAAKLAALDPAHGRTYADGLAAFDTSLAPLRRKIAELRARHAGAPVTATEPVFDYMAHAVGVTMRNTRFQRAVMNDTEPGPRTIAAFEDDLRGGAVKVLFYNAQTELALAQRMRAVAIEAGVPVVTVTETQPPGQTYPQWMLSQLDALDRALSNR